MTVLTVPTVEDEVGKIVVRTICKGNKMIRRHFPDPTEPIVLDGWTSSWVLAPASLPQIQGVQHALHAPRAGRGGLWELRGGEAAFKALRLYGAYYAQELDLDPPVVPSADAQPKHLSFWIWALPAYDTGVRMLGAAAVALRTDVYGVNPSAEMTWCWLFPLARHRGLFSAAWNIFIKRYPHIQCEPRSMAMKISLYGRPSMTLETGDGQTLRLYTQDPECTQHGPMRQGSTGAWDCYAKLPDGHICTESWVAPKPISAVPAVHETRAQRTA